MKLLSTTPLPSFGSPQTDRQPIYYRSIANESYIVVALDDTTVHVLSSRTGVVLQKRPFAQPGAIVGGLVLDGDNLILAHAKGLDLTVYNIPSE
jgi:hypothetical protein